MTKPRVSLLIIDPQNDFCDIPQDMLPLNPLAPGRSITPALPVPGGHADMLRLSSLIDRLGSNLDSIYVTLDSHNPLDIAHPSWWANAQGTAPAPFTVIEEAAVRSGLWRARDPALQAHSQQYVEALQAKGRYSLVIWPEHCLIGQWGHNVHASVAQSLNNWARTNMKTVDYVTKGINPLTEHYSAIQAEVPDEADPSTWTKRELIGELAKSDKLLIAGEALSHCVASTVRDLGTQLTRKGMRSLVLLTDCTSSVAGFEQLGSQFLADMALLGMRTAESTKVLR